MSTLDKSSTAEMSTEESNTHIYSALLNPLQWGLKTWNLTDTNLKKLKSFHHSARRWILVIGIRWEKMKEERNMQTRK